MESEKSYSFIWKIAILLVILIIGTLISNSLNYVINLEKHVDELEQSIEDEETARIDYLSRLINTIEIFKKFDKSTMDMIISAKYEIGNKQASNAEKIIEKIIENNPDISEDAQCTEYLRAIKNSDQTISDYKIEYTKYSAEYTKIKDLKGIQRFIRYITRTSDF